MAGCGDRRSIGIWARHIDSLGGTSSHGQSPEIVSAPRRRSAVYQGVSIRAPGEAGHASPVVVYAPRAASGNISGLKFLDVDPAVIFTNTADIRQLASIPGHRRCTILSARAWIGNTMGFATR